MNITTLKYQIKNLFSQLFTLSNLPTPQGRQIFEKARSLLGTDVSPEDLAQDELGCAESVSTILAQYFPPFQVITGTYTLYLALKGAVEFVEVKSPLPGDIVISPTGLGGKNKIKHGHTGIVGEYLTIMSNDSATGKWITNYTVDSWRKRYGSTGGYPVVFFRKII